MPVRGKVRIRLRAGSTSFPTGKPGVKLEVKTSHEGYASAGGNVGIPGEPKKRVSKQGSIGRFEVFFLPSPG